MKKCNNCGREFPDSANVCSQCGTILSVPDEGVRCPTCGEVNPAGSLFCMKCGTRLVAAAPPPPVTGNSEAPSAQHAPNQNEANAAKPAPSAVNADDADPPPPYLDNPVGLKQKVVAYEYKHNIIGNVALLVLSFVIALMALLTPINLKYRPAQFGEASPSPGYNTEVYESDMYVEVHQNVFKAIGAMFFMAAGRYEFVDGQIINPYEEEFYERLADAQAELLEWQKAHPPRSEDDLEKYSEEYQAAAEKILSKHISKMNYIAYALTTADEEDGAYFETFFNVTFSLAIAILAVTLAIVALVNFVFALVGVITKKRSTHLFSFLGTATVLSVVQLILTLGAPRLVAVGGAFATTLVAMLAYLIAGTVTSVFRDKVPLGRIVKNGVVAALMLISFFLLCGNTVTVTSKLTDESGTVLSTVKIFGDSSMLSHRMFTLAASEESMSVSTAIGGIMTALSIIISAIIMGLGTAKQLKYNALGYEKEEKSPGTTSALTTAIVLFTVIVVYSLAFLAGINTLDFLTDASGIRTTYTMRAATYISMALMVGSFVFDKAYRPEKKKALTSEAAA